MNRVPARTVAKWRRMKKDAVWTFGTESDGIADVRELRDLLLMAERERRRAWRTVFLYQNVLARLVRGVPRTIDLPASDDFHCPRCGKKAATYSVGGDGYVSCFACAPAAGAHGGIVLENPRRRH